MSRSVWVLSYAGPGKSKFLVKGTLGDMPLSVNSLLEITYVTLSASHSLLFVQFPWLLNLMTLSLQQE